MAGGSVKQQAGYPAGLIREMALFSCIVRWSFNKSEDVRKIETNFLKFGRALQLRIFTIQCVDQTDAIKRNHVLPEAGRVVAVGNM